MGESGELGARESLEEDADDCGVQSTLKTLRDVPAKGKSGVALEK